MFRKNKERISYDIAKQQPAIKTSICTGEMVAGFVDSDTGKFHDYMLISGDRELDEFCARCGVSVDDLKRIV